MLEGAHVSPVEQNKQKRAGTGLRAWDRERACPGYTLFAPITDQRTAYLIDLAGVVVHTWEMPCPPGYATYLTGDGTLFYNGKAPLEGPPRFMHQRPARAGVALEADWDGQVLWQVSHADHHHDGIRLRNGNVMLLCLAPLPADIARSVRGGIPGTEFDGTMHGDYLVEMTTSGQVVWQWRSWEHLDPDSDCITPQDRRHEWTHANAVAEMPDGNLVVSFRYISTVVIVDRRSGEIIWKLGPPLLAQQHSPVPLPDGRLLLFDNGTHRADDPVPYSRVIDVDIASKRIVWCYQERDPIDFFSPFLAGAQRLPNGNTLICEGNFGRFFEVAPDGVVVWEYVNPYFGALAAQPGGPLSNAVFRALRYSEADIERARQTRGRRSVVR
jgi:hypothetical protein